MRTAAYLRVSTDEQARDGVSLAAQRESLLAFCKSQRWEIADIYMDDGFSGKNLERPALQRLIADAQAHRFDVVLVWKLDRLSRRQRDVLHLIEDVFGSSGVGFKSATESFDTTTPGGKAMVGMLAVFAQLERETIIERTKMGKARAAAEGRWYSGRIPYGYTLPTGTHALVADPDRADVVRMIYSWYVEQRWGVERIAMELTARGVPNSRGGRWWDVTVAEMLRNPAYIGKVRRHGTAYEGQHEGLVDEAIWRAAQRQIEQRRGQGRRLPGMYLLSAVDAFCGLCGSRIHGHAQMRPGRDTDRYYVCGGRYRFHPSRGPAIPCTLGTIPRDRVEGWVLSALEQYAADDDLVARAVDRAADEGSTALRQAQAMDTALRGELRQIESRLQRWWDAFETGAIAPEEVAQRTGALRERKAELDRQLARLAQEQAGLEPDTERVRAAVERLRDVAGSLRALPREECAALLPDVVDRITLYRDRADVMVVGLSVPAAL